MPDNTRPDDGDGDADKRTSSARSLGFLFDLPQVPCFRSSLLYGILAGGTLAALRFYRLRRGAGAGTTSPQDALLRATDLAVKSTVLFAGVGWVACRYDYRRRREMLRGAVQAQQEYEQRRRIGREIQARQQLEAEAEKRGGGERG